MKFKQIPSTVMKNPLSKNLGFLRDVSSTSFQLHTSLLINFVKLYSLGYRFLLDSAAGNMLATIIRLAILNRLYNNQFVSDDSSNIFFII